MKDIDFDELDKAVTSLMGNVRGDDAQNDQPVTHSLTVPTTLREDERPEYATIRRAAARIGGETIARPLETTEIISEEPSQDDISPAAPPLAAPAVNEEPPALEPHEDTIPDSQTASEPVKVSTQLVEKRGRFMDVFHPSSDMKQRTNSRASAKDEAVTVADQQATQDEILPGAAKVSHEALTLTPLEATDNDDIPVEVVQDEVVTVTDEVVDETSRQPSLTTPFLPGAKVEKRPLGGGLSAEAFPDESVAPIVHRAADDPAVAPQPVETVPDEFQDDVMAIELAGTPDADLLPDDNEPVQSVNDVSNTPDSTPPTKETVPETETVPIAQAVDTAPQASVETIPAPEAQAESLEQSGAIYDTTEYHAPVVAHPAKHSSWVWVVLIIVIIVVGAVGGAAAYWLTSMQ